MYQLRPMNCPFHINIYKHGQYSYRDLPLRYAELGTVYRYERSGTMHGLFRVRGFTQVSAVLFCVHHWLRDEGSALAVSSECRVCAVFSWMPSSSCSRDVSCGALSLLTGKA